MQLNRRYPQLAHAAESLTNVLLQQKARGDGKIRIDATFGKLKFPAHEFDTSLSKQTYETIRNILMNGIWNQESEWKIQYIYKLEKEEEEVIDEAGHPVITRKKEKNPTILEYGDKHATTGNSLFANYLIGISTPVQSQEKEKEKEMTGLQPFTHVQIKVYKNFTHQSARDGTIHTIFRLVQIWEGPTLLTAERAILSSAPKLTFELITENQGKNNPGKEVVADGKQYLMLFVSTLLKLEDLILRSEGDHISQPNVFSILNIQ